jgi:NitT/TauT family transport system permease protein
MFKKHQGLWGMLAVLLMWQVASMLLSVPYLPPPVSVSYTLVDLLKKDLLLHLGASFLRVLTGLFLASVLAVPSGLILGRMEKVDRILSPILYFFYPIPKIAFLPLVMLTFGIGDVSAVFMITLVLFFQIFISARDGIKALPREYFYVMTSFGSSEFKIYYHVILPGALPRIFTTLRVSLGTALSILFFTETQAVGGYGIGYFIFDSMLRVQYREMFAGIGAIGMMGWILFKLLDVTERILVPWMRK